MWDYYGFAVGTNGIDPDYFWYEMTDRELQSLFKAHNKESRKSWEQTRLIAYHSIQFGKNPPKIRKFMPFDWDNEDSKIKAKDNRSNEERRSFASNFANAIKSNINGK